MDKLLIKNLNNVEVKRAPQYDGTICPGTQVKTYTVEGETSLCKFWNSSNNNSFDKRDACKEIVDQILSEDNLTEGSFSLDFNEIMFEITEK